MFDEMEKIRSFRLPNGALLLSDEIPEVESVAIGIWSDSGSANETPEEHGLSHLLEHMLFKGTECRSAYALAEEIEDVGGSINAFTERETIHLYARVLAEHLPVAIELLADMVCHSTFAPEELERERQVVFEEIYKYQAVPEERIQDVFMASLWQDGALGHSVLGTLDSVRRSTSNALHACRQRCFRADRVLLTIAGKIEQSQVVDLVSAAFSALPLTHEARPPLSAGRQVPYTISTEDEEQVQFCWGGRSYPAADERNFALAIVDATLGGNTTSRLFQEIREKRGLAYDVSSFTMGFRDTGLFCADGATSKETFPQVIELVQREVKKMRREGISSKELARAREQIKTGMALSLESTLERMRRLAMHQLTWDTVYPLRALIDRFNKVSEEDIQQVIDEMLNTEQWSLAAIGPVEEREIEKMLGKR